MNNNIFLKDSDFYQRNINPIEQYIDQMSFYLYKMTGRNIEDCRQHVVTSMKDPAFNVNNPTVRYYERNEFSDKEIKEISLSQYIDEVTSNNEILSPTFTTYLHPSVKESISVGFIDNNKRIRGVAKKQAFRAQVDGNTFLFLIKDNEQSNMKLYNNSMSGAYCTKSSVLYNPSAHSTLTSTTRSVTSISNASNEKIIEGNRHYYNLDVTLNNLISLISNLDRSSLESMIKNCGLIYPSIDDVINCIKRSTDLYWHDKNADEVIKNFITKLDPIERAAIVYIGDLYHVRLLNDSFIKEFLTKLSKKVKDIVVDDPIDKIHKVDEAIINFVHQICMSEMKGKGKEYEKLPVNDLNTLVATCINVESVIIEYKDFIENIFLTNNVPGSTSQLPNMMRRTVTTSDTDSTLFSTDSWVDWYFGGIIFNDQSIAIAASIMFLATQCIAHSLAIFSANMNVTRSKLFDLQMKPEFAFPVFAQTAVAKHYYTLYNVKEGNVFEKPVTEIKGVHLKNSAAPKSIVKLAEQQMVDILNTIMNNKKISIVNQLKGLADLERRIADSLINGEVEFFKHSKIKSPEAYANSPEQSPYAHHLFWTEVFSEKYGAAEEPPYLVIKIPTVIQNITGVKKWLDSIEDKNISNKLASWFSTNKKTSLPTIYLSDMFVGGFGIPEEIKKVMDVKRIVLDLTLTQRMIIDSLGYCIKDQRLVSELGY